MKAEIFEILQESKRLHEILYSAANYNLKVEIDRHIEKIDFILGIPAKDLEKYL